MGHTLRQRNLRILHEAGMAVPPAGEGVGRVEIDGLARTVVSTARGPMALGGRERGVLAPAVGADARFRPGGTAVLLGGADLGVLGALADRLRPGGRVILLEPWPALWSPLLETTDLGGILGGVRLEAVADSDFTRGLLAFSRLIRAETAALGSYPTLVSPGYLPLILASDRGARPLGAPEAFAEWSRALSVAEVNTPSEVLGGRAATRYDATSFSFEGLVAAMPGLASLWAAASPGPPPPADDLSVVIVTYRWPALLNRALRSLGATWPCPGAGEVIVVDNGGDAETRAVLEAHAAAGALPLRPVVPGANLGPVGGRNLGARLARGRYLLFLDDDVEFIAPGWWGPIASAFATHPRVGCVGGFGVVHRRDDDSEEFIQRAWLPGFPLPVHWTSGFAFAVRREAWDEMGGHPAVFGRVGSEDADVGYLMRSKGWMTVAAQEPLEPLYIVHRIAHRKRAGRQELSDRSRGTRILKARWGRSKRLLDAFESNAPMPLAPRPLPDELLEAASIAA